MNERLSRFVARLLAHPAGFLWFNVFTIAWFTAPAVAWWVWGEKAATAVFLIALAGYLDVVTYGGGATQFTLAFQNARAQSALDEALASLIQLARNDIAAGDAIVAQAEAIWSAVGRLDEAVAELLKLAHSESEIQATLARQDESIVKTLETVRELLEGHASLAHRLARPIDELLHEGDTPSDA